MTLAALQYLLGAGADSVVGFSLGLVGGGGSIKRYGQVIVPRAMATRCCGDALLPRL